LSPAAPPIRFVLVAPQHPGNVGAVARAMKNLGFTDLAVVAPAAWDPEQARWMAPGCDDLLGQMRIHATLDEALVGITRVIGTTARHRRRGRPVLGPADLAARVAADPAVPTAILFGREDHGLAESDLARCEALLRIPTAEHASLNLGQAALLTAWTLFDPASATGRRLGGTPGAETSTAAQDRPDRRDRPADVATTEPVVAGLVALLGEVGYLRGVEPGKVALTFRRLLQRAAATVREVEAIRGMVGRIRQALEKPRAGG
jgi:TrmH family RNA methyltransferase